MLNQNREWKVLADTETMHRSAQSAELAAQMNILLPTAQLLINRGYHSPASAHRFFAKEDELFHDPFLMRDMRQAAEAVLAAVEAHKRIVIYGDYDVDGVTSVCSLYLYLQSCGANVSYYIPDRLSEGYGISETAVRALAAEGISMMITVDTGITAVHEVALAQELGMTVVVTDHHECQSEIPAAAAVINPHRTDDTYPFSDLAGVGVVFKLLCAMEILRFPDRTIGENVRNVCLQYADLIAIGTVADIMPVTDENRLIVAFGLHRMETNPREGIRAILAVAGAESKSGGKRKITSSLIGFTIAPRLNAAGRMGNADTAVELFLSEDAETAIQLAYKLSDINRSRQNEENKIAAAAYAQIDAEYDLKKNPVIVLADDAWHHGVIGIVSSRITEKYGRPSILISFSSPNASEVSEIGKGSGRSIPGMNLVEALDSCADILEKFGGHELAAGLSIRREMFPVFVERINAYARTCFADGIPPQCMTADCELEASEITMRQAEELYALEPYGNANPVPVFVTRGMTLTDITAVGGGKHLRISAEKNGISVTVMYFRHALSDVDMYPGDSIDVMYNLDINEFQGIRSIQCIAKDIRLTESVRREEDRERMVYRIACEHLERSEPMQPALYTEICPEREDCIAVYTVLKRELSLGHEVYSMRAMQHLLRQSSVRISYARLKFILRMFDELQLVHIRDYDEELDAYRFQYVYRATKTSLEKSLLLQRIHSCAAQS